MNKDLCVFIPTYKRTESLKRAILSVIESCIVANVYDIAIYISNNVYDDKETRKVISEIRQKWEYIFYTENKHNLGIDANMRKGFEISGIKYCLMLSDDDRIHKDAITRLLKYIRKYYDATFFIINWMFVDQNGNEKKAISSKDKVYTNAKECFVKNHDGTPYGTIVCNLNEARKITADAIDKYEGTFHLYSGILWEMAEKSCKVIFIGEKLIIKVDEEKAWAETRAEVLLIGIPLWYDLIPAVYQKESRKYKEDHWNKVKSWQNLMRILNGYNLKDWHIFRMNQFWGWGMKLKVWVVLLLFSLIPKTVFHGLNLVFKRIGN